MKVDIITIFELGVEYGKLLRDPLDSDDMPDGFQGMVIDGKVKLDTIFKLGKILAEFKIIYRGDEKCK